MVDRILVALFGFLCFFMSGMPLAYAQERPVSHGYQMNDFTVSFQWGDISLDLERWATPYYYRGEVKVRKDQLPELLQSPIQFFRNGKPFWIKGLDIQAIVNKENQAVMTQDTTGRFPPRWMSIMGSKNVSVDSFIDQRALLFTLETQSYLLENMAEGDHFSFSNYVDRSSGLVINSLNIEIENPWEEFSPQYIIAYTKPDLDALASWQIVNLPGNKQRLRYDPADSTNQKIRLIYTDPEKYDQIPIPAFRTANRYISETDYVVPPSKAVKKDTLMTEVLDPYDRLDCLVDPTSKLTLQWGDLLATLTGYYYKPVEYYDKGNVPMQVHIDEFVMPVRQVLVSIVPVEGDIEQILIDGMNPGLWYERMNQIPSRTSIYFDEILVEDRDGKIKLLPQQFMFNLL